LTTPVSDKTNASQLVAVITGDIVKSQSFSDTDFASIMKELEKRLGFYALKYDGFFDIFRGDAFQFVTCDATAGMHVTVGLRLAMKAFSPSVDVKLCCGVGRANFRPHEVKTGTGEAFILSGRGLDSLKGQNIALVSDVKSLLHKTQLLTQFADAHISGLTQTQSETVLAYLISSDKNHDTVATSLGKNRSNITRILNASHYKLLADYVGFMEQELRVSEDAF
jgi:hypothetical protein